MNRVIIVLIMVFAFGMSVSAQRSLGSQRSEFVEGALIVKLKPTENHFFEWNTHRSISNVFDNVLSVNKTFPLVKSVNEQNFKRNTNSVDLSLIYNLTVNPKLKIEKVIHELIDLNVFEYVERREINYVDFTPNDTKFANQNYFTQINALSGWDISHGSASMKIGIVDTGTDMEHPDLKSKIYENVNDPINGVDDDGDGYIDNFLGWDFMDNDGTPQVGSNNHGAHVSGIAAAATNNSEGVASVGFDTEFMPVRVGDGVQIVYGYEGIVYAADMGCDVINCSWGGFSYSAFSEDVINYATFNKDALVVCAAGNQGRDQKYYPAAYENALAVTSVNSTDAKSNFSNYGYWADIAAPGENIYSTIDAGQYNYNTGTSMATPIISGAAALVKSVYPQLTAMQIAERLKTTSDDISGINFPFLNKVGTGRLNVGDAVTGVITDASVVFGNHVITNTSDNVFKGGDSLLISGTFTNYLGNSGGVSATLSSLSPHVVINKSVHDVGVLASLEQVNNYSSPFSIKILDTAPLNTLVTFKVTVTDGVFTNMYFVEVLVNVDYLNIAINNLATSIGSKGQFGYNNRNQEQGLGVRYNDGVSQLFEGGLMIGTNKDGFIRVVDRIRSSGNTWDDDFKIEESVKEVNPAPVGDYYVRGIFNDSNALADTLGLTVLQNAYASTKAGHENYVVLEYQIINTSADSIPNLNVGLFADFDIANFDKNSSYTDLKRFMTYTVSTETGNSLFGIQLLTQTSFGSYCLDNVDGGQGGVDIVNGFNNVKKFMTISSNRYGAGIHAVEGNDVIQVTSTGGFGLQSGDTVKVAFAILGADYLGMLEDVADSAYKMYNGELPNSVNEFELPAKDLKLFPNPAQNRITIDISQYQVVGKWDILVYDVTGRLMIEQSGISERTFNFDINRLNQGVYLIEIQLEKGVIQTKFIKNSN